MSKEKKSIIHIMNVKIKILSQIINKNLNKEQHLKNIIADLKIIGEKVLVLVKEVLVEIDLLAAF
jgi:hypothetical protein